MYCETETTYSMMSPFEIDFNKAKELIFVGDYDLDYLNLRNLPEGQYILQHLLII